MCCCQQLKTMQSTASEYKKIKKCAWSEHSDRILSWLQGYQPFDRTEHRMNLIVAKSVAPPLEPLDEDQSSGLTRAEKVWQRLLKGAVTFFDRLPEYFCHRMKWAHEINSRWYSHNKWCIPVWMKAVTMLNHWNTSKGVELCSPINTTLGLLDSERIWDSSVHEMKGVVDSSCVVDDSCRKDRAWVTTSAMHIKAYKMKWKYLFSWPG